MENNIKNHTNKFVKWAKICIFSSLMTVPFSIFALILSIMKKYTNVGEQVPFLYSKTFVSILLVILFLIVLSTTISFIKARSYKKLIERDTNEENEDSSEE